MWLLQEVDILGWTVLHTERQGARGVQASYESMDIE